MRRGTARLPGVVLCVLLSTCALSLAQQQPMAHSSQQQIAEEGVILTIAPATIRWLQRALNRVGFDAGNVDGIFGKNTSAALANFQRSAGLDPTGQITVESLQALQHKLKRQPVR